MANDNSNGTTNDESSSPSLLNRLHAEFVRNGSKLPSKANLKPIIQAFEASEKAVEAAEKALLAAKAKHHDAVVELLRATGKGRKTINGRVLVPMGRGETVFFRDETGGQVQELT